MRLGFIVGRGNEVYRDDALKKKTPKKFLVDNHGEEVAKIFIDLLSDRHRIDVDTGSAPSPSADEPPSYAVGAVSGE